MASPGGGAGERPCSWKGRARAATSGEVTFIRLAKTREKVRKDAGGSNPRKTAARAVPDTRLARSLLSPPAAQSSGRAAPEAVVQRVHVAPGRVQQQIAEGLGVGCARRVAQAAAVLRGGKKQRRYVQRGSRRESP